MLSYQQGLEVCKYPYSEMTNYFHVVEKTQKGIFDLRLGKRAFELIEEDYRNMLLPLERFEPPGWSGRPTGYNEIRAASCLAAPMTRRPVCRLRVRSGAPEGGTGDGRQSDDSISLTRLTFMLAQLPAGTAAH
jgi:hypothetical protein